MVLLNLLNHDEQELKVNNNHRKEDQIKIKDQNKK
jgi:hypothetical protein